MGAPFYIAETGLYWGRMLIRTDPARAHPLLDEALALAQLHGFGEIERGATATLTSG